MEKREGERYLILCVEGNTGMLASASCADEQNETDCCD